MAAPQASLHRAFLLAALPAVAVLGLGLGATALTALAVAGLAILARSFWLARRPLLGLSVRRVLYPSAFEDDAVAVELVLENSSRRTAFLVEITDAFGPGMSDHQVLLDPGPFRGGRRRRLMYRTFCSRPWGLYAVGPLSIRTSDPMGLFEGRRAFPQIEPFAVFPKLHPVAGLERPGARPTPASQSDTRGRPGPSPVYLGVRDYRPGDDRRRIHWPATARRGSLTVKEHEVDLLPYVTIFVDLERRHRAGTGLKSTLEYVLRTGACLAADALRKGDIVQVFAEGQRPLFVPPGRGEAHLARCLYELIQARQDGTTPGVDLVERERLNLPEGSVAAAVFGSLSVERDRLEALLQSLRSRGVRPLLVFVDEHSFVAIHRRALPREEALDQRRQLEDFLRDRGVPGCILSSDAELATDLSRPDLFEPRV